MIKGFFCPWSPWRRRIQHTGGPGSCPRSVGPLLDARVRRLGATPRWRGGASSSSRLLRKAVLNAQCDAGNSGKAGHRESGTGPERPSLGRETRPARPRQAALCREFLRTSIVELHPVLLTQEPTLASLSIARTAAPSYSSRDVPTQRTAMPHGAFWGGDRLAAG